MEKYLPAIIIATAIIIGSIIISVTIWEAAMMAVGDLATALMMFS